MPLKVTFRRNWLRALRSGKYEQAAGTLRCRGLTPSSKFGYCCLGVAAEVLGAKWMYDLNSNAYRCQIGEVNNVNSGSLTQAVLERIGMTDGQQQNLITMNDGGVTFKQIADYIEKNL
jgi:hypothetical protein